MRERARILLLIAVMSTIAIVGVLISIYNIYQAGFDEEKDRLREIAESRARIIESVAKFDQVTHPKLAYKERSHKSAFESTLSQIRRAHSQFEGFGKTGEFTLARRDGDEIVFLLSHRHGTSTKLEPVPFASTLAEPMRRALNGQSGTMVGPDYRGQEVLAAHEPVNVYDMGIVAKIDLEEVRRPFIRAAVLSLGFVVCFVVLGTVLILHIGNPIIEKLEHEVQAHQIARRGLVASEASLRAMVTEVRDYAIFMLDREGRVVSWNAGAQAIKGYAEREIIGRHFSIFYPVDEIEGGKPRRALSTADREGRFEDEGPRLRKDGSIFWANVVITALKEQNGSVSGYLKVTRDVTDKQQASANIKQSLHDKEVLLREIHHRVKNNLQIVSSLLSLQSKHLTEAGAIAALEESRNRINTMAMIHQKLYGTESLEKIDIRDYIQTFARNLFQATRIEPSRVDLKIDVDDVEFDLQQAIPTGMIINELLSNSLKHAFPRNRKGAVHISLHERESLFVLNFKDDGVGFPTEMNPNETESLGLRLVNMFTQQLDGTIQCLCGEGAQFRISFSKHRV